MYSNKKTNDSLEDRGGTKRLKEISWGARAEEFSVTIVIKRPSEKLAKKWQLAVEKDLTHLLIMPRVSKK